MTMKEKLQKYKKAFEISHTWVCKPSDCDDKIDCYDCQLKRAERFVKEGNANGGSKK